MELIITEKPSSAQKIAESLADTKPKKITKNSVSYYELTVNDRAVVVASAVGHLFTVAEKEKKGWTYPVFDVEWVPSHEQDKGADFTKKYLTVIKQLAKKADTITIATDFDIEGEVIGYTILKYACKKDDGQRMKYSTVTKKDLQKSYENKMPTLAWGQAYAGVTRHELDWYYGINLSRALTLAVKTTGGFKILSSGRVQTPALKILSEREKEIQAFKPDPYWQLELHTPELVAMHETDKFWKQEEATTAQNNVTKTAEIESIETKQFQQAPPHPFDLTSLQTESYRSFRMSPKETMQHAQDLYSAGYISYPRTSSQQLPEEIGYQDILKALSKQKAYGELAQSLLAIKKLKPNNGKKTDPAHPAIFPTGAAPSKMRDRAKNVYDIIVRRFMATFGSPATRETMKIKLESGKEIFQTSGTRTVEPGWHVYYGPHVKLKEEELPSLKQGQTLKVDKTELLEKETQPPKRYTPSSIIKELEKRGLGTKATRADIVENLFNRGYVHEDSIQVTEIGMLTIQTLEKYVPEIIDEQLTKQIEEDLEGIREESTTPEKVLTQAKSHLTKVLENFKKHEKEIGKELMDAEKDTRDARTILGKCTECDDGELQIRKGRFGLFVGCSNYPDCKNTFNLPSGALVKPSGETCPECGIPTVLAKRKKSGWQTLCINKECKSKGLSKEAEERKKEVEVGDKTCPKCEKPLMVRKSAYGAFIGCTGYPKCRYTEKLEQKEEGPKASKA